MDDVLVLIKRTFEKDKYGVEKPTESRTEVFCRRQSVTRAEFFDGGRNGLNPELVFTVFHGDYSGEELIEYHGRQYAVYRTYRTDDDYIELYAERKGGANG